MNDLVADGVVRHVGVSNFGVDRPAAARRLSDVPILTDQVQFHPYRDQSDLLASCRRNDVLLTAYSPPCHGGVLDDPVFGDIARPHGKTPAQVAPRWVIRHENVCTVPKATSRDHLAETLDVFDFELVPAETERIRRPSKLRTAAGFVRSRLPI